MAESMKEIIERLKAQHSQKFEQKQQGQPRPVGRPPKVEPEAQVESMYESEPEPNEYDRPEEEQRPVETPKPVEKHVERPKENVMTPEQRAVMEIELLQNDGRFRGELLFQIQELNKNLVGIASILVDMDGKRIS